MKRSLYIIAAVLLLCGGLRVALHHAEPLAQPHTVTTAVRPEVYYGYVVGGVHSLSEFSKALASDKALAKQYAGFDFKAAHFETTKQTQCVYVGYRKGSKFAWTTHCKLIPKGTLILTDGRIRIKAECGNVLSVGPQVPVIPGPEEPNALPVPEPITMGTPSVPEVITPTPAVNVTAPVVSPVVVASPPFSPWVPFTPVGGFCCVGVTPTAVPDGDDWKVTVGTVAMLVFLIWAYTPKLRRTK